MEVDILGEKQACWVQNRKIVQRCLLYSKLNSVRPELNCERGGYKSMNPTVGYIELN